MPTSVNRQIVLRRRPVGMPKPGDFDLVESPLPAPKDGEILTRTIYLSLDPYMRGRISGAKLVRAVGRAGAGDRGRHRRRGARVEAPGPRDGRHRAGLRRLAIPRGGHGRGGAQARSEAGAGLHRAGRARHARHDRLRGPARHRPAEARARRWWSRRPPGRSARRWGRSPGSRARARSGIAGSQDKCDYVVRELGFDACVNYKTGRSPRLAPGRLPGRHRRVLRERGRRRAAAR